MKPWHPLILLFLFSTVALAPLKADALTGKDFRYYSELPGLLEPNRLYQVHLSADLLKRCRADCQDLRVLDSQGGEIPYVILDHTFPAKSINTYELTITDYTADSDSATLVLKVPEQHQAIESIELVTSDQDFKKHIMLYSSDDANEWKLLAKDAIYDFSSQVNLRKTVVKFEKVDRRYFRLQLIDDPPLEDSGPSMHLTYDGLDFSVDRAKGEKLQIHHVLGRTGSEEATPAVLDEAVMGDFKETLDDKGNTVVLLDAGLPFDRMEIDVANPSYYYRNVEVYFSDTGEKDSYRFLTHGTIYRFPLAGSDQEKNQIGYSSSRHLSYKIVVVNGNNPPLDIRTIKLRWIRKNIHFIALNGPGAYSIYLGHDELSKPAYDLSKFIRQDNWTSQPYEAVNIRSVKENKDYVPTGGKTDRAKIEKMVLLVVVAGVAAGLVYWLYFLLKRSNASNQ